MDGDFVTETPSDEASTLTEMLERICPRYMAMGMTYDEFWNRHTRVHKAYREAYELRRQQKNWELWLQGMYDYNALLCVAPVMRASFSKGRVEPGKYPEEPFPLSDKEAREREQARQRAKFEHMLKVMTADSEAELKRRAEQEVRTDG